MPNVITWLLTLVLGGENCCCPQLWMLLLIQEFAELTPDLRAYGTAQAPQELLQAREGVEEPILTHDCQLVPILDSEAIRTTTT